MAPGSRLKGWLNTDIEPGEGLAYLDATKRLPFEDGSVHYIFSEHVIEHLTYDEGKAMAAEAYRVLAPGGKIVGRGRKAAHEHDREVVRFTRTGFALGVSSNRAVR